MLHIVDGDDVAEEMLYLHISEEDHEREALARGGDGQRESGVMEFLQRLPHVGEELDHSGLIVACEYLLVESGAGISGGVGHRNKPREGLLEWQPYHGPYLLAAAGLEVHGLNGLHHRLGDECLGVG